jgi:6-phosphogluconolactonase (cycloisomerase 2 family)
MKRMWKPLSVLSLLVLLAIAGCNGFFVDTNPASAGKFGFVANSGGGISAYTVGSNGALAAAPGSPFAAAAPAAVDADGGGVYVYAASNGGGGGIYAFTITRTTGALGAVAGSPFNPGTLYAALVVDPAARYVFALNSATHNVEAYKITSGTGVLTPNGTAVSVGAALPNSMFEDPSGNVVFVAVGTGVVPLKINSDGTLTAGSIQGGASSCNPGMNFVTVTPNAKFLYTSAANATAPLTKVCVFSISSSSGALTEVTGGAGGSPVAVGAAPQGLAADGQGHFLYVANSGDNTVSAFTIGSDGRLTAVAGSPFSLPAGATGPVDVNSDPSGQFLYVVNNTSNSVSMFTINTSNGVVSPIGTAGAGTGPVAIVTTP